MPLKQWSGANVDGGWRGHPPYITPEGKRTGIHKSPQPRDFFGAKNPKPAPVAEGRSRGGQHTNNGMGFRS